MPNHVLHYIPQVQDTPASRCNCQRSTTEHHQNGQVHNAESNMYMFLWHLVWGDNIMNSSESMSCINLLVSTLFRWKNCNWAKVWWHLWERSIFGGCGHTQLLYKHHLWIMYKILGTYASSVKLFPVYQVMPILFSKPIRTSKNYMPKSISIYCNWSLDNHLL